MPTQPLITQIDLIEYSFSVPDLGVDASGYNLCYAPGAAVPIRKFALKIHTDAGVTGEYVPHYGATANTLNQVRFLIPLLLGKKALERERFYTDSQRVLRQYDRMGAGLLDIALWDLAGKLHKASVSQLLGGFRSTLPVYASTYHGDRNGGLDSPEAYADFARQCLAQGYPGFKIHGWNEGRIDEEVAVITAVGRAVGGKMALMVDPACELRTWSDTLRLGQACDEWGYLWLEDPSRDGGLSIHGHAKLLDSIKTPILITEHTRGLAHHVDVMKYGGTTFCRADPEYDGGITGALKIAQAAETMGLDCEVHASGPAHRALMSAMRNSNFYELALVHPKTGNAVPPVYADGYNDQLDCIDANGCVPVPDGPGLGVTYDWDKLASLNAHTQSFKV